MAKRNSSADSAEAPTTRTRSEHASKEIVAAYGVRIPIERCVADSASAVEAAEEIGFPVVLKLTGEGIAHKTERRLVRLAVADARAVEQAAEELLALSRLEDGEVSLLVAEQVQGQRELIAGFVRDPQFGPCVLLGLGGILADRGMAGFADVLDSEDVSQIKAYITQRAVEDRAEAQSVKVE